MIDVERDALRPVHDVIQDRLGHRVSPATSWRWIRKGVDGVRLEAVLMSKTWMTTPAAFAAFLVRRTERALGSGSVGHGEGRSPATEQKLIDAGLLSKTEK